MVMSSNVDTELNEFDEVLKSTDMLVDESVQIYELENEKGNVIDELYNSLKVITEFLGFSIELPAIIFNEPESTKVTLNPSLDIIIKKENGKIEQKRLDEFSTKNIAQILKDSITPIIELCKNEKVIQNKNITFLKAVTGKLEKIQKINSNNIKSESFVDSETRGELNNSSQQNSIPEPQGPANSPEVS